MRSRLKSSVNARRGVEIAIDALMVALAWYLAFPLLFDKAFPDRYQALLEDTIIFVVVGKVAFFTAFGLYNRLWRFLDQSSSIPTGARRRRGPTTSRRSRRAPRPRNGRSSRRRACAPRGTK